MSGCFFVGGEKFLKKFLGIGGESGEDGVAAGKSGSKKFFGKVLTKGSFGCILSKLDSRGSLKTEQCIC